MLNTVCSCDITVSLDVMHTKHDSTVVSVSVKDNIQL